MGKLSFVGLGLGSRGISLEGVEEIRSADIVYLEYYTSPHEPRLLEALQDATKIHVTVVDRAFVEDGNRILADAKEKKVVLAVQGDPMVATTHDELRGRAIRAGIETRLVHAATIASAAASASGLHYYKFSRTVTVTMEAVSKLTQAYHILHQNLLEGAHTLLLLEYDEQSGDGISPPDAIGGLLLAEANFKREVVGDSTFALVLSRVGRHDASLSAGEFADLAKRSYGEPPHSLLVPGKLHFTETESISAIFGIDQSRVRGNSEAVVRTAQTLVPRYVLKTRRALDSLKSKGEQKYAAVIENAELYMRDAEKFLANGQDEMAMLSIGYAEGLMDSLSFAGLTKIEW